jgi:hypothetical protein
LVIRFKDEDNELLTVVSQEDLDVMVQEYEVLDLALFDT